MILLICFVLAPQEKIEAATAENPLLEYSYHVKIDLRWLEDFFQKALVSDDPEEKYRTKMKDKFYLIENTGIFALDSITLDCRLEGDRFVGNSKIDVDINPEDESFFQMMVSNPPQLSVVRALIPQDEPFLWISAANPSATLEITEEFISSFENLLSTEKKNENSEDSIRKTPIFKLLDELSEYTGNESHFVIYDYINTDYDFSFEYAVISTLKEDITESEIEQIKGFFKSYFADNEGVELSTWKWENYDVLNFKEWESDNLCLLVDKYYIIFSSSQESLRKTAEYVLTPSRTAQSQMPVPMNFMLIANLTKVMKCANYEDFEFLFGYSSSDQKENFFNKYLRRKRYGTLQLITINTTDGIYAEYSLDKTLANQIIRMLQGISGFNLKESMKSIVALNDMMTGWNLDRINSGIRFYYSEHNKQYPESIDSLMEHYKAKIKLSNPFTKEEMRNRAFSDRAEGDFTYIPIKDAQTGLIKKYYLIGYGDKTVNYDEIKNDVLINKGIIEMGSDGIVDDVMYVKSSEF